MKHIHSIVIICALLGCLSMSSCATMMRYKDTGDAKHGFNLATTDDQKITVKYNGKELKSKLIYDGSKSGSSYKVYKYYMPSMDKKAVVNITHGSEQKTVKLRRGRNKGWFWVEGLPVIVEQIAGKLYYYDDVDLSML